jgi:HK97 family phage prohead protease
MLIRDFPLRMKSAPSPEGAFTGLAAAYSNVDLTGDLIEPGSFRQAIAQQGKGFPLLWAHRQDEPIGLGQIEDSKDGLLVHGQLLMSDPLAIRAHEHLKAGTVRGLSIGFTVPRGEGKALYRDDGVRVLKEIRVHEISVVAVPANPEAAVFSVKSLSDARQLLRSIRTADSAMLDELAEINFELRRLLTTQEPTAPDNADALCQLQEFATAMKKLSFAA